MKTFRKVLAILLLMTMLALPAAGLGEGGFEMLKMLMDTPLSEDIPVGVGQSITSDVTQDTAEGVLCLVMFSTDTIMISGINENNKYEIVTYDNLSMSQMLYYCYVLGSMYGLVESSRTGGGTYGIIVSYGEGDDSDVIMITNEDQATQFAQTIMDAVKTMAGQ